MSSSRAMAAHFRVPAIPMPKRRNSMLKGPDLLCRTERRDRNRHRTQSHIIGVTVYLVLSFQRAVFVRVRVVSDMSSTIASAPRARRGGSADRRSRGEREPKRWSGRTSRRTRAPGKKVQIAGLALIAAFASGYAGLAATAVAVTVAVTICTVSALLGARLTLGAARTNELVSWIALAASIAGLAFAVTVTPMAPHEPVPACQTQLSTAELITNLRHSRAIAGAIAFGGSRRLQSPERGEVSNLFWCAQAVEAIRLLGQEAPQIPADLDLAKTALESALPSLADLQAKAHNPKAVSADPNNAEALPLGRYRGFADG